MIVTIANGTLSLSALAGFSMSLINMGYMIIPITNEANCLANRPNEKDALITSDIPVKKKAIHSRELFDLGKRKFDKKR